MNIFTNRTTNRRADHNANSDENSINWDQGDVTLRLGVPADDLRLARLAKLDSSGPMTQPILLAELDGALVAAISLSTNAGIADPLHRTAGPASGSSSRCPWTSVAWTATRSVWPAIALSM